MVRRGGCFFTAVCGVDLDLERVENVAALYKNSAGAAPFVRGWTRPTRLWAASPSPK
jgi:hypothetical protein